jgi:transposase-like protein
MLGHGAKFGRKKEEAIAALLSQRNIEEAARAINVAPNTLLHWMKLPEFQTAYREARRAAFGQSIARLQQASSAAVSTLLKIMVDTNSPASTRVRAADSVLDHSAKSIELEDIEARVAELERAAQASGGRR